MSQDDHVTSIEEKTGLNLLLDSKYPLIQEFREKCPGTHKHAQSLVSMIEGVSIALDLDEKFMKVAALYHDVGKMFNPKFFTENQLEDENPHNGLSPKLSYEIITRHVSDSVIILINDGNFPRDLIEVMSQHHGTNILRYFADKSGGNPNDYRYKTTKPNSVEGMVLMICDHIEATSRSLAQAGKLNPENVIEDTINLLINDGQLDDVTLKLGDLKKIKMALAKELEGVYQKRVDYDTAKEQKEKGEEE